LPRKAATALGCSWIPFAQGRGSTPRQGHERAGGWVPWLVHRQYPATVCWSEGWDHRARHRTEQKSWPPSVRERTELVVAGSQPLRRHRLRPRLLLQILGRAFGVDGFSVMVGFALVDGDRLTANGARENKRCVIRHGCPPLMELIWPESSKGRASCL